MVSVPFHQYTRPFLRELMLLLLVWEGKGKGANAAASLGWCSNSNIFSHCVRTQLSARFANVDLVKTGSLLGNVILLGDILQAVLENY